MSRHEYPVDPVTRPACGTYAGWSKHVRGGERQCGACLEAGRIYTSTLRARRQKRAMELMQRYVTHREVPHVLGNYGS